MGTNYYYHHNPCKECGRSDDPIHIGKSSCGWCFSLHVYPDGIGLLGAIKDLNDWIPILHLVTGEIRDEYNRMVLFRDLMIEITECDESGSDIPDGQWFKDNYAELGPNGLARQKIDGDHCIGHGAGTWDLCIGEFC